MLVLGGLSVARAVESAAELLIRNATFEELANLTVTTVSRHEELLFTVPAATSVLTREAVHDSGALTLPEALREVPGLNVARITADAWAIGARGFQAQFASMLLVMVDGRSIYSSVWGGVPWEDNPVFLEDLDRVEVVRGPGSSIWGANAVNGVINILSRSAFETQGSYVFGGMGNELEAVVGARQGFRLSEHTAMRLYGQYQRHGDDVLPTGASAEDGYRLGFGGARLDWTPTAADSLTMQAGFHDRTTDYVRNFDTLLSPTYTVVSTKAVIARGQNISGSWRHAWENGDSLSVRGYWDHIHRDRPQFLESVTAWDFDAVYSAHPQEKQLLSAGLGYRSVDSNLRRGFFGVKPERSRLGLFNGFVHDELTLLPDHLQLSLGTKVEYHQSTGWNLQPSVRLAWLIRDNFTIWSSVGQAVRIPYVQELSTDSDVRVYPPGVLDPVLPATLRIIGNPDLKPEKMTAFEAGVRWKSPEGVSIDLAAFANRYRDYVLVSTGEKFVQSQPPALVLGQRAANGIAGDSYGGELALNWDPRPWWRLAVNYSYVQIQLHALVPDPFGYEQDENKTPHTTIGVSSDWRLGRQWQMHWAGRYVDPVPFYGIPSYAELDARLAWQVSPQFEISLVGRNLLDARHPEYDSTLKRRLTELQRSINLICQWSY